MKATSKCKLLDVRKQPFHCLSDFRMTVSTRWVLLFAFAKERHTACPQLHDYYALNAKAPAIVWSQYAYLIN